MPFFFASTISVSVFFISTLIIRVGILIIFLFKTTINTNWNIFRVFLTPIFQIITRKIFPENTTTMTITVTKIGNKKKE